MSNVENLLTPRVMALRWQDDACTILDQTKLPQKESYIKCESYLDLIKAIQSLAVRGAPLIGIAGAYACVLAAQESKGKSNPKLFLNQAMAEIENARPTAVNLRWAVNRLRNLLQSTATDPLDIFLNEAHLIHEQDISNNRKMALKGATLFQKSSRVLTVCNTGDLATGGIGTAFGVFRAAFEQGLVDHIYACETRPVLQGLRLTAWELEKNLIPYTVICDNMAASLMREGKVTHVITGADRIAANGDSANKIGTYSLAVLAKHHSIPFYIAAPFSTFDLNIKSGTDIPIEQRIPTEISAVLGQSTKDVPCYNPAFDVTPAELITAIICERGIIHHPTPERVSSVVRATNQSKESACHA